MRALPLILAILVLTACEQGANAYRDSPNKRTAHIDDHTISVVPAGGDVYVAWGGEEDRDGFVQYRQQRAIELVSHCRVGSVLSEKGDAALRARVKC